MINAIHVSEMDNVATALSTLHKGDVALGVTIQQDIPSGHKFATAPIAKGCPIVKYESHIGIASCDIQAGEWVHIHNLEGERGRGDTDNEVRHIVQDGNRVNKLSHSDTVYELDGYRREDGTFGFRNRILVIPSVHCANKVVERIATYFSSRDGGMLKDIKPIEA